MRAVLGVGLLVVAGALALDMSGSAPRTAGSDHNGVGVFSATVPAGGTLCQTVDALPQDASRAQILIGTYGHPVPDLRLRFLDASGAEVAAGRAPAGLHEGSVTIALSHVPGAGASTTACLHVGGSSNVVIGGEGGPISPRSELINGSPQPGRISLLYLRHGDESWWQLLGALTHRFGLGKASFFGTWTLPVAALLLLGVWIGVVRLLARELA